MNAKHTPFLPLFGLACVLALSACSPEEPGLDIDSPVAGDLDTETALDGESEGPRSSDLPCVVYCQARADQMRERCEQEGNGAGLCAELAADHAGSCTVHQCSLMVELPGVEELHDMARNLGHELLGEDYEIIETIPHYYDGESVGSRVHIFESAVDQSRAFVEMGATLELPPVVSYGHGQVAEVALEQQAIASLTEFYGPQSYQLVRSHFTAIHPVLEFETPYGHYYYNVASDDVSDSFEVFDDPDPDQQAQMIREQSYLWQWELTIHPEP